MAEDFFNGNRPMVTKDGKDLTSALEVFVNWCITEVQNKIQRSFHPSSSNRPLKKVVVTIQSLLATRPDPVLIGSLFAGSTEELEVLIKILSVQLDMVLFYTMGAAGDMYFVWRDLPIDPKLFRENMHQSLDRARQSAQNIKGAVDLMTRIESFLVAAPAGMLRGAWTKLLHPFSGKSLIIFDEKKGMQYSITLLCFGDII
ncbi:uncharacterized protein [Triticum aestivum]|uniref:uncharacterized protein isoform X1 n=1 Tax=Triticum aestivum TaxID=4565 RepID=UPI001D01CCC8|nr:uncharacterized protein LOC123068152 isoform X1 [Triticum aestivum]XP_044346562.1 uncharacterized protein LOC123068152 isoform X1 [Triticum aestivum]